MFKLSLIDRETMQWDDCAEGPFATFEQALEFAIAEVGAPWLVVSPAGNILAAGDNRGRIAV